jgi:hypothetical protein
MTEYAALVDQFNIVSAHLAPQQYRAAKHFGSFMRLLNLAIRYWSRDDEKRNGQREYTIFSSCYTQQQLPEREPLLIIWGIHPFQRQSFDYTASY